MAEELIVTEWHSRRTRNLGRILAYRDLGGGHRIYVVRDGAQDPQIAVVSVIADRPHPVFNLVTEPVTIAQAITMAELIVCNVRPSAGRPGHAITETMAAKIPAAVLLATTAANAEEHIFVEVPACDTAR